MKHLLCCVGIIVCNHGLAADVVEPKFRAVTVDDSIQIGYGVAVADVDGDKKLDILLADKRQFVWYRNPAWDKFLIAENLTPKDNVCLAAQDIDGDGKCELAVGAEWNPGDTENSGAVFYMIPPADRTPPWTPVKLHAEPTTHRMRWIKFEEKKWGLVVVPLHGRGNKNGKGAGVKVLLYQPPAQLNDPKGEWKTELIHDSMHMTHNFEPFPLREGTIPGILLAGKEGLNHVYRYEGKWRRGFSIGSLADVRGGIAIGESIVAGRGVDDPPLLSHGGIGEVRVAKDQRNNPVIAAVEPMHGTHLVVYDGGFPPSSGRGLTSNLVDGHGLACGDLLGLGSEQIVVGWRGKPGVADSTTGVAVWTPLDEKGEKWRETIIDRDGMACEDLQLVDLNGDGKLAIVASGRATKNVKIYFNETPG